MDSKSDPPDPAVSSDLADALAAERAARRHAETRFEQLSALTTDGIAIHDGSRITFASRRLCEMFGYPENEILGRSPLELCAAESRAGLAAHIAGRAEHPFEGLGLRRDGSTFAGEVVARNVTGAGGGLVRVVSVRDVSWRRAVEEARRASETSFLELLQSLPDGMVVAQGGRIAFVNRAFAEAFGYAPEELIGRDPYELVHPDDRVAAQARGHATATREVTRAPAREVRMLRKDGGLLRMESTAVSTTVAGKSAVVAVFRDVSERHRMEHRLIVADRLAATGTLAAGLAHEINNPLTTILVDLELVERALGGELCPGNVTRIREHLAQMRDAAWRTATFVRELRLFSHDEPPDTPLDVNAVVRSTLRLADNEIRHRAGLRVELGSVAPVRGSEARLGHVLLNLIVNAIHAVEARPAAEAAIDVRTRTDASGRVVVEVCDNGTGIGAEDLPRIFDPYFTTKGPRLGTGLGLSISQRLIQDLGGSIEVESELGRGTCMRIVLPVG